MYVVYYQELLIWNYAFIFAYYYVLIWMSVHVLFGEGIRCPPPSEELPYLFEAGEPEVGAFLARLELSQRPSGLHPLELRMEIWAWVL